MHLSCAYSLIGYSGATVGDTETARSNTAFQYRISADLGQMTQRAAGLALTGAY
jgi:hypothetical protein